MNVLIVDDEKLARERLVRMVDSLDNYGVAGVAACGEEAVRQAVRLEPDIVLLDIRMPGMDGMEAARQLSTLASPPAVIFCTAFGEHAIDAFNVNASGYLMKPVRREALTDALVKAREPLIKVFFRQYSVKPVLKYREFTAYSRYSPCVFALS